MPAGAAQAAAAALEAAALPQGTADVQQQQQPDQGQASEGGRAGGDTRAAPCRRPAAVLAPGPLPGSPAWPRSLRMAPRAAAAPSWQPCAAGIFMNGAAKHSPCCRRRGQRGGGGGARQPARRWRRGRKGRQGKGGRGGQGSQGKGGAAGGRRLPVPAGAAPCRGAAGRPVGVPRCAPAGGPLSRRCRCLSACLCGCAGPQARRPARRCVPCRACWQRGSSRRRASGQAARRLPAEPCLPACVPGTGVEVAGAEADEQQRRQAAEPLLQQLLGWSLPAAGGEAAAGRLALSQVGAPQLAQHTALSAQLALPQPSPASLGRAGLHHTAPHHIHRWLLRDSEPAGCACTGPPHRA
jgi:hypothetical protein